MNLLSMVFWLAAGASRPPPPPPPPMVVIFGRPGAGKTTVAQAALTKEENVQCLDLDVCVPQWMKDNFSKGIYPTLAERLEFAKDCCDYVDNAQLQSCDTTTTIVSFSFVNTDLRNVFRERFPDAVWALIDTTEQEAQVRIEERQGHFYKGKQEGGEEMKSEKVQQNADADNSEWEFAPVTFPHTVLDGKKSVEENARIVRDLVMELRRKAVAK